MMGFALARGLLCSAFLVALATVGQAQTYPSKPLRIILPYVPGGIIDTAGRNLALRLSESLGQSVVAENRPGAGGMVGADVAARSTPDGYTMLLTDPALVSNPTLQTDVPYDLFKGLQAVSIIGSSPAVIVASPTLPVTTFAELIAYAKANPGKLNFASAGIGTAPHLAGEMIKLQTGIEMTHVPYRGIGAAYPDVMSGKVQLAFSSIAGAVPFTSRPSRTADRNDRFRAQPSLSERGDRGRVRLARVRRGPLDRHLRAGWDAAGGAREAQQRIEQGAAAARAQGGVRQDRHHAARHQSGGGRGLHPVRIREVEEGDRGRQDQAGVTDRGRQGPREQSPPLIFR